MNKASDLSTVTAVRAQLLHRISEELDRAYAKHGKAPWGRHEFYAILKEEVDELWDAIKADEDIEHVQREAIQVAAMVFRWMETSSGGQRCEKPEGL